MAQVSEVIAKMTKDLKLPEHMVRVGSQFANVLRIPTGLFTFDLGTGGGYPQGRMCINYGTESSTKTLTLLLALGYVQKHCLSCGALKSACKCATPRHKKGVLLDVENCYDPVWGASCGIDNDDLIVVCPDYAEQAVDIAEALAYADDVGLIGVDSIAAMITFKSVENSAETAVVGGNSVPVTRMVQKLGVAMATRSRSGDPLTVIFINQIRMKIGVMFGNPETMGGGNALKFASSLTTRFYGKDKLDKDVSEVKPVLKEVSCVIHKWKVPIFSKSFDYDIATTAHKGYKVGQQPSWSAVSGYLKNYGVIAKVGTKWVCFEDTYAKLGDIEALFKSSPQFLLKCQQFIIDKELSTNHLEAQA